MDRIHRTSQFGARAGRTATPWWKRDRNGTFPAQRAMTGPRYDTEADALRFPGAAAVAPQGAVTVDGRVSRRGQREDLYRQVVAMETHGLNASLAVDEWRSEMGGGLHFKRQVFSALRERIENRAIAHLPMAHQDRWTRFGCDGFEPFAQQHGCTLTVVNQESLSPREEMVEDWMVIVDTFASHLHGLRSYRKQPRKAVQDG